MDECFLKLSEKYLWFWNTNSLCVLNSLNLPLFHNSYTNDKLHPPFIRIDDQ